MMIGFGRYNLLLKLGQGGMGSVYLARQKTLRRFCAVKVINPQYSRDEETANRFLREARATASLSHPHLVQVFDCDQFEGQHFIAMEYVEGMSLGEILRKQGSLLLPLVFHWIKQATIALEYIHSKEIVHRDIKPDNMIIDGNGTLKIMDLGLAKDHFSSDLGMTVTGTIMGSPHYMSPEQINDSKTVDARTDIYSLGICFYQMIVGKVPFHQTTGAALCVAHLQQSIPSVFLPDAQLTDALDGLIAKMTAKEKKDRFQSASEVLTAIEPWIESNPIAQFPQDFLDCLGFENRKVANLMLQEGSNDGDIDADLHSVPPVKQIVEPTFISSSTPDAASSSNFWLKASLIAAILVLLGGFYFRHHSLKKEEKASSEIAPQSEPISPAHSAQSTPAPAICRVGALLVKTTPDRAIVFFGTTSKQSPADFSDVEIGKYTVKISKAGYQDIEQEVGIKEGIVTELNISLKRLAGNITIESFPPNAQVLVNGEVIGETPQKFEGFDGDTIDCTLRLEGYRDKIVSAILQQTGSSAKVALTPLQKENFPKAAQDGFSQPENFPESENHEEAPMTSTLRQKLDRMFYIARETPADQWPKEKKAFLDKVAKHLKEERKDTRMISEIHGQMSALLDRIRQASDSEIMPLRHQVRKRLMEIMRESVENDSKEW